MPTKIPFLGGSFVLSEAGSFKGSSGDIVSLDTAVIVHGGKLPVRLTLEMVDAIADLAKSDAYKEFAKKERQRKK